MTNRDVLHTYWEMTQITDIHLYLLT